MGVSTLIYGGLEADFWNCAGLNFNIASRDGPIEELKPLKVVTPTEVQVLFDCNENQSDDGQNELGSLHSHLMRA